MIGIVTTKRGRRLLLVARNLHPITVTKTTIVDDVLEENLLGLILAWLAEILPMLGLVLILRDLHLLNEQVTVTSMLLNHQVNGLLGIIKVELVVVCLSITLFVFAALSHVVVPVVVGAASPASFLEQVRRSAGASP